MKQEYIIPIVSLLLFIFLAWKEMKRPSRASIVLRLFASAAAIASLACFIIPVTYKITVPIPSSNEIVLLTAGASKDVPSAYKNIRRITTDPSLASGDITFVADLPVFLLRSEEITALHILGYGIEEHEWKMLEQKKMTLTYSSPSPPVGFLQANWPQVIGYGDRLNVYGTYRHTGSDSIKIILSGLGAGIDSTMLSADSIGQFYLHGKPSHTGATVYELQAFADGKLMHEEKLPVNILPASRPRVLFLSSSPDFEKKFLTSWLYQNSYPVAVRNTVSQGKHDQQFLNMPVVALQHITPALLEKFDLLIADDLALSAFSVNEAAALKTQLNKGMGMIIQTDSSVSLSGFSRLFAIKKQAAQQATTRSFLLPGLSAKTKPLPAEQWFSISPDPYTQSLVTDEQQSVIVCSRLYGAGKIILNTAASTFSWMLSGNEQNYAAFWSLLLNKAARSTRQENRWHLRSPFPTIDYPVNLVLETESSQPPIIKTGAGELFTTQTSYLPDTWTATWWPASTGWQTLSCVDTINMYVFEKSDWASAKASELISRNNIHIAQKKSTVDKINQVQQQSKRIPVVIFYLVFIAACSYLWWEAKRF